ncbi:hypothetical protein ACFFX1_42790 [Dactylosporangium sucinum]|uniref:Uncharacterized protein n=1 Tax=Dactylosporangium sucinum TaxID=1424081 RepID=A0A917WZF1_9ACTN|nr:hypothetical protein [Dactylosporangium sucinum]GGM44583.1 hypothetical protein GCM10007977_052740 [Dactylosporangium sucinum]
MNCRTQVLLAAGIGYLLGRQHKLRWGLLLAAAAASGRLSRPGGLLQHGVRALSSAPELRKLGELGAPLVSATKDAARTAVTSRIGSVSDRLRERTDALRSGEGEEPEEEEEPRRARRRRPEPEPADEYERDEEEDEYEEPEEEEEERAPVTAGARSRGRPPVRRRGSGS